MKDWLDSDEAYALFRQWLDRPVDGHIMTAIKDKIREHFLPKTLLFGDGSDGEVVIGSTDELMKTKFYTCK